jgi:hypothetical protein
MMEGMHGTFGKKEGKGGKRSLVSIGITALIISLLIFSGPASAVTVSLEVAGGKLVNGIRYYKVGDVISFTVTVDIYTNDLVPFSNATLYDNTTAIKSWNVSAWATP